MDVIFATDNNFCQYAGIAIMSLLDNNREESVTVHLFCVNVEGDNIAQIEKICSSYNSNLKVYNITDDLFKEFPDPGVYSIATYLRLLAPTLLRDVSKVIYIDCDVIINGSLKELYDIDLSGYSAAGVNDASTSHDIIKDYIGYDDISEGYANAGVLLINLNYWREKGIQSELFNYLNTHDVKLNDQDAINAVLHGTIKFIHPKWNTHVGYFAFPPLVIESQKRYIKELWSGAKIIHFTGPAKAWCVECVNPYKKIYLKYKRQSVWRDMPQKRLESSRFSSVKIVFLRKAKNIVANIISFLY